MIMPDTKNYEALANAIVAQAARDYQDLYRVILKNPNDRITVDKAEHIKRFFRSEWFRILTGVEADYLLRKLEDEVKAEAGKRRNGSFGRLHGKY